MASVFPHHLSICCRNRNTNSHVGQLFLRLLHGRMSKSPNWIHRPQNVGWGSHSLGNRVFPLCFGCLQTIWTTWICYTEHGFHDFGYWFLHQCVEWLIFETFRHKFFIMQSTDMFHEKWGFMVIIFWNFSGVPFISFPESYMIFIHWSECHSSHVYSVVYMASHDPATYRFSTGGYIFIYTVLCTAYYIYGAKESLQNANPGNH